MPDPLDALRLPVIPIEPRPAFAAALLRRIQGVTDPGPGSATVRYFVADVDRAVEFYCQRLGFEEELRAAPAFAMLYRGDLRLLLSAPGGGHALPDGTMPEPGGWNRISLRVADLAATVAALQAADVPFRAGVVRGPAVRSAVVLDPSGNPIELFEPLAGYHERR